MEHEFGHVLLGAAYHPKDKRSIMYPYVGGVQSITPADRELFRGKTAGDRVASPFAFAHGGVAKW